VDSKLRERLGAIARNRRIDSPVSPTLLEPPPGSDLLLPSIRRKGGPPLERILPGEEIRTPSGVCWRHTRPLAGWPGADPLLPDRLRLLLGKAPPADLVSDPALALWRTVGFSGGVFLDLETTGLSATPVFLAGLVTARDGEATFQLLFARDYSEEKALLETVAREFETCPVAITYNGKSYDFPFLRERISRLRVAGAGTVSVLDLLHAARRRWRRRFPDCRLATLEAGLCGKRRAADIRGRDIPDLYHRFVQDHDPRPLLRVFSHNIEDLATLMLLAELILTSEPESKSEEPLPTRTPRLRLAKTGRGGPPYPGGAEKLLEL
jgi:hypothetical protein